jgi:hypothetical protein
MPSTNKSNNRLLWQYAGLATQLLVVLAITLWAGIKLDKWLRFSTPLFTWIFPLIAIIGLMIKVIKDTSKRNNK